VKNITAVSLEMVQGAVLLLLCTAFAASLAFAGEGAYNPPPVHYICTSNPAPNTRYYSAIFKASGRAADYQPTANAFGQFLAQKYGIKSPANCLGNPDQSAALHSLKQEVEQLRMAKWTLIQTKWTYNGAPSEGEASNASSSNSASSPANSASSSKNSIDGDYVGTYACAKGPTHLKLTLKAPEYGLLTGTFTFYLPPGSHTKAYTFSLNGHFDPKSGSFNLNPLKWETPPPSNFMMVGLKGAVDANAGKVSGVVDYTGCGRFEAMKGRDD
jgi:hypothetical protein